MKRQIVGWLVLGLVLVGLGLVASEDCTETITIASWNIQGLGVSTPQSRLDALANTITAFDIVALQEIKGVEGMENLLERVEEAAGIDWDYVISPRVGSGGAAEHYVFLFRTDCVSYVEETSGVYPELHLDDFSREPFFATFRAGEFDFTLITVHITCGELPGLRTEECERLQSVWSYVQARDPLEDDLILLGDFNRDSPGDSAFAPLEAMKLTVLLDVKGTRTTFGRTSAGGSWYDHIWIDATRTGSEFTGEVGAGLPIPEFNSAGTGCPECLREVSDHCPVWAVFTTTADDDPVCQ